MPKAGQPAEEGIANAFDSELRGTCELRRRLTESGHLGRGGALRQARSSDEEMAAKTRNQPTSLKRRRDPREPRDGMVVRLCMSQKESTGKH